MAELAGGCVPHDERACPYCGRANDHHEAPNGARPDPGDVSLCWGCASLGIFTADGGIRRATREELDRLLADPKVQRAVDAARIAWTPRQALAMARRGHLG